MSGSSSTMLLSLCLSSCTGASVDGATGAPNPDTTPPLVSNGSPVGTLASGTTQATVSVTTDESALCKWGTTPATPYASLPNLFTTTGDTTHRTSVTGLADGGTYAYYVRCVDDAGNANGGDYLISFNVNSVSGGDWPNEPAGFVVLTDYAFDDVMPSGQGAAIGTSGWSINNNSSYVTRFNDAGAPLSPPNTSQWLYPQGFGGGDAPATMYWALPTLAEAYAGYWWKPSQPWDAHGSNVNKISFLLGDSSNGGGHLIVEMYGPDGGPYHPIVMIEFSTSNGHLPSSWGDDPGSRGLSGNVSQPEIVLGQWHRIEVLYRWSTSSTSQDGVIRWWMDGQLVGDYTTVNFMNPRFVEFQFSPTWGGIGETKSENDYYWFDHVHLSRP